MLAGVHVLGCIAGKVPAKEVSHLAGCLNSLRDHPRCPDTIRKEVEKMCETLIRCPGCTNDAIAACVCRSRIRETAKGVLKELFQDGCLGNLESKDFGSLQRNNN